MSPDTRQTLTDRTAMWRGAVEMELRDLIAEASQIRKEIDTAKTNLKKEYFKKKFKKVTEQVMQMLTALERVKSTQAVVQQAAAESTDFVEVTPNVQQPVVQQAAAESTDFVEVTPDVESTTTT